MTIEDLFDTEYKLRQAARNYADGAIARNAKELRLAAVAYAKLANAFESAFDERPKALSGCLDFAASDTPDQHLIPDACPNCPARGAT